MFVHYLKLAWRNLLKYRTQNIISIVGLAVGILSFSVCFYVSRLCLDIDKSFDNHGRMAVLQMGNLSDGFTHVYTPYEVGEFVCDRNFKEIEACCYTTMIIQRSFIINDERGQQQHFTLNHIETDTLFNKVFMPEIIAGSWYAVSRTDNAVIMSESCAERMFGNAADAVGKTLTTTERLVYSPSSTPQTGGITYTVEAVIKDIPQNTSLRLFRALDVITVNDRDGIFASDRKFMTVGTNYVLLSSKMNLDEVNALFEGLELSDPYDNKFSVQVTDQSKLSILNMLDLLIVVGFLGLLMLLVGFINFFHFLIGSFINRSKEFSMMKLYGNDRRKLFMLLFTECLLKILFAFFLVLWMIEIFMNDLTIPADNLSISISTKEIYVQVIEYMFLAVLLCAAVSWSVSMRISNISIQNGIFGGEGRRGKLHGRNIMLAFQFVICWIFLICTAALYLQAQETNSQLFDSLSKKEKENIFSVSLDYPVMDYEDKMLMVNRMRQHAGVKDILLADISYLDGTSEGGFFTESERTMESFTLLDVYAVPDNFFSFMNLNMEQGRMLQVPGDIIVDRNWQKGQGEDVIGMSLYSDTTYRVCGICPSFNWTAHKYGDGRGTGFVFEDRDFRDVLGHCYVKCHDGQAGAVKEWIEGIRRDMLPANISPQVITFAEDIDAHHATGNLFMKIILFFSAVSLILTLFGVYSSIILDTESRRKEMAIRKINGADLNDIMLIFCKLYVILLSVTAFVTFPIAYFILGEFSWKYVVFFDYGPLFWLGVFAIVAALTFITIIFRILHTARENPAEVLKRE